jgi:hypothetical protein
VLEAPELIPDLAAWYDSRTDAYFALSGSSITAWMSRAGSMGGMPLSQGVAANQPLRVLGVAEMNNQQSVLLDGVDDFMSAANPADWPFLHDNTGATIVTVERVDSTGIASQHVYGTLSGPAAQRGLYGALGTTSIILRLGNGSGAYQNAWTNANAAHYARDVSRWRAWAYGGGSQKHAVSGSTLTNADAVGQTPSASAPEYALRVGRAGAASSSLKGHVPQILVYKRVLTAPEIASLGAFFAPIYGIAA